MTEPPGPITWATARRSYAVAGAVGLFLSFVEAFGTSGTPFVPRSLFMIAISWIGVSLGLVTYRLAARLPWGLRRPWLTALTSGLLMWPPMSFIVWGATWAIPSGGAPVSAIPSYFGYSLVMCVGMTFLARYASLRRQGITHAAVPGASPVRFLERLPLKLRGGEVWAVEAEDHYLRLHTSKGQDLILLRLADAVAELEGIEGAQVHRSWWVARDAVAEARRGDGRATLTLKDGSEVPVSRTYAKLIRERGWM
jgi:hypothetical protein